MARRGARVPCPVCRRPTAVSREFERIWPHRFPDSPEKCTGSGAWVDLYARSR